MTQTSSEHELPDELIHELHEHLTPMASPWFEGLSHSLSFANKHNARFVFRQQPHLWSLTARAELRMYFEKHPLPPGWILGGDSRLMGQIIFINSEAGLNVDFLKENRRVHPGGIPPAGSSKSRRQRWATPATLFELDGIHHTRADQIDLHFAWDYGRDANEAVDLNTFQSRILHTTEAGQFGRPVGCNFFFNILPNGELHTTKRFDGDAAEEDFFLKRDTNDKQQ